MHPSLVRPNVWQFSNWLPDGEPHRGNKGCYVLAVYRNGSVSGALVWCRGSNGQLMGNLPVHKVCDVQRVIGVRLVYLSLYSPAFNPIENLWLKVKGHVRQLGSRTLETLYVAIAQGLSLITLQDVHHWFTHC